MTFQADFEPVKALRNLPSSHSDSALMVLVHTSKILSIELANRVNKHGFTLDEWLVLDAIKRFNGGAMSEISAASSCYGASLTRTVDKLVSNSYVYREASRTDRRKVEVYLAQRGLDVHDRIREDLRPLDSQIDDVLDASGYTELDLIGLLAQIQQVGKQ